MRRCVRMVIALLALSALAPAALASDRVTVHGVAAALRHDPVYVAPAERGLLPPSSALTLRRRIGRLDPHRIQIAVVPAASADRVGGIRSFANAVDQAMPDRRGSLIATTGQAFQIVTSHTGVETTLAAVRHAIGAHQHDSLGTQLLAAVDGVADVDPGPGQDVNGPPASGTATAPKSGKGGSTGGGSNAGLIVAIVLGAAVLLPLLFLGVRSLIRWRARRKAASQVEELDLGSTRDELLALGQDVEDLDIDTQMPNASPAGLQEYQRALMLYDRANRALAHKEPSQVQIYEAKRAVEEGRARIQAARNLLSTGPGSPPEAGGEAVHPPP